MLRPGLLFLTLLLSGTVVYSKTEEWLEVRSPHFTVVANSNEKQARRIAGQFERMRSVFHKVFPSVKVDPGAPIIVLAVKDKKGFQALEPEAYLAKGQLQLAGMFLRAADKNYVLLRLDAEGEHPYATVYHEYTHLLVSHVDGLPLWLNEGLAQFYENTDISDKEASLGQPNLSALYSLQQNRLIPLATLFAVDNKSPFYHEENKGSIFYAESWALTHYLVIKDFQDKTSRIPEYVKLVAGGSDPVAAASTAFGDLKKLQSTLEAYVMHGQMGYFKMASGAEFDEATLKVRPLTISQADAVRADFLAYNQRLNDARALLDHVLRDDSNNVLAQETMGFLAFRENKLDEAQHWYEQAVKLDSQSYLAHYYFAVIAMREGVSSDERRAQIEASFKAATKLNPSFAPAFDAMAMFYAIGHKDLEQARQASVMAVQLDPSNIGFRLNTANVLMQMEREKDAVSVLQYALKMATSPDQTAMIQSRIESIQNYQAARERMKKEYDEYKEEAARQESVQASEADNDASSTPRLTRREDDAHGPKRVIKGTIRNVQCADPALSLNVEGPAKPVSLRSRNYYKIEFSALNFKPERDLSPCKDLEGMKAKVEYFEPASATAKGLIVSIELTK